MFFEPRIAKRPPIRFRGQLTTDAGAPTHAPALAHSNRCFSHGRVALRHGLLYLDLPAGSQVLLPEFICEVILPVFTTLGLKPVYYPVREDLTPDWRRLSDKLSANTRALLMVHFFGIPQTIVEYQHQCQTHGLTLIEDNAHGFGGRHGDALLGTFGDIGISSPWKNFPVESGGILHLPNPHASIDGELPHARRSRIPSIPGILRRTRCGWLRWNRSITHDLQSEALSLPPPDRLMHPDDRDWLANQDLQAASARRRGIYRVWESWCAQHGLQSLFTSRREGLPGGAAPLVYPALTTGPEVTRQWFEWAFSHGIEASSWPKLPAEVFVNQKSLASSLWERLVCFPIHQYMEVDALEDLLARTEHVRGAP